MFRIFSSYFSACSIKPQARCFAIAMLMISLSGCASFRANLSDSEESRKQYESVDIHSAYPTVSRENIEQINLLELIDPQQQAKATYPTLWAESEKRDYLRNTQMYGPRYDLTLSWFRQSNMSPEGKRLIRNGVQERMLAASMSRCNVFKTFLRRNQSDVNFYLGSATTVAGILGAVVPGIRASHNLAATAGIFSGLDAEYNQAYFANLTAEVLIKGIELKQSLVQEQLRRVGQSQSIFDYPMEAAIRDAIYFDGLCSTVVGLEQAAESINHEENPGLQQGLRTIMRVKAMNEAFTSGDFSQLQSSGKLTQLQNQVTQNTILAAIPMDEPPVPDISEQFFLMEPSLRDYLHAQANMLRDSYKQKYETLLAQDENAKKDPSSIALPDEILRSFETKVRANLIDKLSLNNCGTGMPNLVSRLAKARNDLRRTTPGSDYNQKSEALDSLILEVKQQQNKLDRVVNLAKQDINKAAEDAKKKWASTDKFTDLIRKDNENWFEVKPTASLLPACPPVAVQPVQQAPQTAGEQTTPRR